ncbi:hypothetical protein C8A03DRAFT_34294 [Achaetomium macrosporum]|uniref:Uncharacterized protein n=1 Tax=Achaetomium macrosporum TaxID=79813 RepID=A0AAN7CAB9_9PEZI|nr:hypothetical protein C8A03DRAFT_34294 [Achaetomium macrosporum]
MASTKLANLPEMLLCLAEQIPTRRQLITLFQVNKKFYHVLIPTLYQDVAIGPRGIMSETALSIFAKSSGLRYTRRLVIEYEDALMYGGIIQRLLPNMPCLESFTGIGSNSSLAPPVDTLIGTVHQLCPWIKEIYIIDSPTYTPIGQRAERVTSDGLDLPVSSALRELTLVNLSGDLSCWRSQVIRLLSTSPGIQALKLSLNIFNIMLCSGNGETWRVDEFFDRLCRDYEGAGSAPLRLRKLYLGQGMYPKQPGWLTRLTDPGLLEQVDIDNQHIWSSNPRPMVDFSAFGHCPRLRRFSVAEYGRDVHHAIASSYDQSITRQLAVSCSDMETTGQEPAALLRPHRNYPSLPLRLRATDISLNRANVHIKDEDGHKLETPSAEAVIRDLVSVDDGTLEGLTVWLDDKPGTAVDGFEHLPLLLDALPKLAILTQLAVELDTLTEVARVGSPLWDPSKRADADFETLARMLATAGPRLRYIGVRAWSLLVHWRVRRNLDGTIRLELLDNNSREVEEVDVFWEPAGGRP